MMEAIKTGGRFVLHGLDSLSSVVSLIIRLYVANVFWKSGMTKIASWDTTLALFENEYAVPLLPSDVAAVLGTGAELFFPVLLFLGLGT
ncbi:MAG: DoxX family protein, partial [Burkholderiales bacterium]